MGNEQATTVILWWCALSVVASLNILVWIRLAATSLRVVAVRTADRAARFWPRRRLLVQLVLSGLFTFGCAFRSFLPRSEGQRICLVDSWISNAILGRAVATVAELALVGQFALVVYACATTLRSRVGIVVSFVLLPLIVVAEVFSWYTTLTTNFIGSVIEESLWASMAMLMTTAVIHMWPRLRGTWRRFFAPAIVLGIAYVLFMWSIDVPMYQARRSADDAAGKVYVSLANGWRDAWERRVVTRAWSDWKQEIPWMSLYFSVGVWVSMAMVEFPRAEPRSS